MTLSYETLSRHKVIYLLAKADQILNDSRFIFLYGGKSANHISKSSLTKLIQTDRTILIDHFLTIKEKQLVFSASDVVALPYIRSSTSSGVLTLAANARKPVIVSDFPPVNQRMRNDPMGWPIKQNRVSDLVRVLQKEISSKPIKSHQKRFFGALERYSSINTIENFENCMQKAYTESLE